MTKMMTGGLAALVAAAALAASPAMADTLRIGMLTTLSGPGAALGVEIRDGFALALKRLDGRLGGAEVEIVEADDQLRPDVAVQLASRMIERDEVQILTGTVFSNLAMAIAPIAFRNETFYLSPNAGPSQLAGAQCSPYFFNVAWQNDNSHEAMGAYLQSEGVPDVYLLAPNYPAGQDALAGVKRFFEGEITEEIYTRLDQLDYAAELADIASKRPSAVYFFLPGGLGINFIKQYHQAGLMGAVPLYGPSFSFDQDVLDAVGDVALGVFNTSHWAHDLDNDANHAFVEAFQAEYGRIPSLYASQGYDAAMLIDAAVSAADGKLDDPDALRAGLRAASFDSVRGPFRFNTNHYPIQNFYVREVVRDDQGRITNALRGEVFTDHADVYAEQCPMSW